MLEIMLTAAFPVGAARAFDVTTDPAAWHTFFPGFVRFVQPDRVRWSARGDEVTLLARGAGLERRLRLRLEERVAGARVRFFMRQRGFPEIEHERFFLTSGPEACRVCFVARYQPRAGLLALADRVVLARALRRGFRAAAAALHARLAQAQP